MRGHALLFFLFLLAECNRGHDGWSWYSCLGSQGSFGMSPRVPYPSEQPGRKSVGPGAVLRHTSWAVLSVSFYWREKSTSILFKPPCNKFVVISSWQISALMDIKVLENLHSIALPYRVGQVSLWTRFMEFTHFFPCTFLASIFFLVNLTSLI